MNKEEQFSYCVGRPWDEKDVDGSICTYTYGNEIFYGTMETAEKFKKFVEDRENKEYYIYKLVKI